MGATYQETKYFIPINTVGDWNTPTAYTLSALDLFLEDGLVRGQILSLHIQWQHKQAAIQK